MSLTTTRLVLSPESWKYAWMRQFTSSAVIVNGVAVVIVVGGNMREAMTRHKLRGMRRVRFCQTALWRRWLHGGGTVRHSKIQDLRLNVEIDLILSAGLRHSRSRSAPTPAAGLLSIGFSASCPG